MDRENVIRQRYKQVTDAVDHYPGPEVMGAMVVVALVALAVSLLFGVVSVSVIYAPAVVLDSITIIVLRQISTLQPSSYWRRMCLMLCYIDAHVVLTATVVPVIDLGFRVAYRFQESDTTTSTSMREMQHVFRHWLAGDVCILVLATGCTIYAILTCFLCYATREPIYTSYSVIDLSKLDEV